MIHKDVRIGCGSACVRYYWEAAPVILAKARSLGFFRWHKSLP